IALRADNLVATLYPWRRKGTPRGGPSTNADQAESHTGREGIGRCRWSGRNTSESYGLQPYSGRGVWSRLGYRPSEGPGSTEPPLNFTAIAGNLPTAPAMMGNTVVWKPSLSQIYSAAVIMEVLMEAGLPDGVINMVFADGQEAADIVLKQPDFAGIHFTGSAE